MIYKQPSLEDVFSLNQELIMWDLLGTKGTGKQYKFRNPLRGDKTPNCWLRWYKGKLVLVDFGSDMNGWDMVNVAAFKFNLTYKEAITKIWVNYGTSLPKEISSVNHKKVQKNIQITPSGWLKKYRDYLSEYHLTIKDINDLNLLGSPISPTKSFKIDCGWYIIDVKEELTFSWKFNSGHVKVYSPYSANKWYSNTNELDLYFQDDYRYKTCLLGSSWKDCAVLKDLPISFRAFQSENCKGLWDWVGSFKRVLIALDNDQTGINQSIKFKNTLDKLEIDSVIVSQSIEKDWADLCKKDYNSFLIESSKLEKLII